MDLAGAVVVVTGASSGIGEATVRLLHEAGALPVLAARRKERITSLGEELGGALAVETDVTDHDALVRLAMATIDRYGRIDGLVNNAGASLHAPLDRLDPGALIAAFELHVVSVVAATQAVLPVMRAQRSGRIVNVSSGTTRMVPVGVGGYAATKAALNMLTSVARAELEPDGIAVSLVVPSVTATEFNGGAYTLGREVRPGMVPHHPSYVAGVILRALRTGEACIDIPHGPELPELADDPAS